MADSPPPPPPPHSSTPKSNLPMLYYGLVVVGTAALVLIVYNLIIVRWCARHYRDSREEGMIRTIHNATTRGGQGRRNRNYNQSPGGSSNISLVSSFRYKKGGDTKDKLAFDSECSVCLSGFEEGDEVRQLPTCKHPFHASCIDMWLYSHSDCPLCRAAVGPPPVVLISRPTDTAQLEHSREGLMLNPTIGSV